MRALVKSLWKDEAGQAQVEYGLVVALVAVAIVGALAIFKDKIVALFGRIGTQIDAAGK